MLKGAKSSPGSRKSKAQIIGMERGVERPCEVEAIRCGSVACGGQRVGRDRSGGGSD